MTTSERAEVRRDCSGLPPEDLAFISGIVQTLAAMYCRLHPVEDTRKTRENCIECKEGS